MRDFVSQIPDGAASQTEAFMPTGSASGGAFRIGIKLVGFLRKQLPELCIEVELFASFGALLQDADSRQLLQIFGSSLALGQISINKVLDAAIGLLEKHLHQFLGVGFFRKVGPAIFGRRLKQFIDRMDFAGGPHGSLFYALEDVEDPRLPCLITGYAPQKPAVVIPVPDDVVAEIKDGQVEKLLLDQK